MNSLKMTGNKAKILGVSINSTSASSVLAVIVDLALDRGSTHGSTPTIIFTPNPEFLVETQYDPEFRALLNKADINLPDGIGLVLAGRVLGEPISERVSGADVVEKLLKYGNELWDMGCESGCEGGGEEMKKWTIGIAGARRGEQKEADILIKRLTEKYPNISFINLDNPEKNTHPHFPPSTHIAHLAPTLFNLIFACQGIKKQEKWIWENKGKYKANVFMGVGGSLDFLTGFTYRAPVLIRSLGFEWIWRLIQKPSHIKRIWRAVFVFGWLIIKNRLVQNSK